MRKLTKEDFIEKARIVHGDKYDYSNVEYINSTTPVCIICPIHGPFWQTPKNHLKGHGCQECAGNVKLTTEEFIRRARLVHGDFYDYSKVEYVNGQTKVCIICPIHGEFWQRPTEHLMGHGCDKCGGSAALDTQEFIRRAREIHGDKFDYSKVEYKGMNIKVCIICPIHGEFWQTPVDHLNTKYGCRECSNEVASKRLSDTTESFIAKAEKVHGKGMFDYSLVDYKGEKTHVEIICQHGHHFMQSPNAHLNGHGCPICKGIAKRTKEGTINCNENLKDNYKAYRVWGAMLERCYGLNGGPKYPSYEGVEVCDEWRNNFGNFLEWHNQNYVDGWQLDKDLLSPAESVCYSPDTCCYLPLEINRSIHSKKPKFAKTSCGRYRVNLSIGGKRGVHLGCFLKYEDALAVYNKARAERMRELADKYKDQLSERVYNALINLYK